MLPYPKEIVLRSHTVACGRWGPHLDTVWGNQHWVALLEQGGWSRQGDLQRFFSTSQPQPLQLCVTSRREDTKLTHVLGHHFI